MNAKQFHISAQVVPASTQLVLSHVTALQDKQETLQLTNVTIKTNAKMKTCVKMVVVLIQLVDLFVFVILDLFKVKIKPTVSVSMTRVNNELSHLLFSLFMKFILWFVC